MPKNSENIVEVIDELKSANTQNAQTFKLQLDEISRKLEDIGDGKEFVFVRNTLADLKKSIIDRFSEVEGSIERISQEAQNDAQEDIIGLLSEKIKSSFDGLNSNFSSISDNLSQIYDKFKLETGESFSALKDDLIRVNQALAVEKLENAEMFKNLDAYNEKMSSAIIQSVNDLKYEIKENSDNFEASLNGKLNEINSSIEENAASTGEIKNLVENFSDYFSKINAISDLIVNIKDEVKAAGKEYKSSVRKFSDEIASVNDEFKVTYSELSGELKDEFNQKFEDFQKFIAENIDEYESRISPVIENLKDEFNSLGDEIQEKFNSIQQSFGQNIGLLDKISKFLSEFDTKLATLKAKDYSEDFDSVMEQGSKTQELVDILHTKVDELLKDTADKEKKSLIVNKHLKDIEEKILLLSSVLENSKEGEILSLNLHIEELIKNINEKLKDINTSNIIPEITELFQKIENRLNFWVEDLKQEEDEAFEEISDKLTDGKSLLEELNAKLDIMASSAENEILEDELFELKEIILSQKEMLEKVPEGISEKAESNFKDVISKVDSIAKSIAEQGENSEKIKENIIETILAIFNNTDFVEESEDIKDFVEEKTDELNKQIHDVKSQLKTIKESDISDYSYTLNDVEHDMANLRNAIKDVSSTTPVAEINQISRNIHNLTSSIDAISKNLTPAEIFQLKHGILKLNDDILSISSRTNKLLINSDEASKTISDGVEAFSHIAYNLEERIKEFSNTELVVQIAEKLEKVLVLAENSASSDNTVQKVLMFLGEWVDAVSDTFEKINTKTDEIQVVSDMLSELKKTLPQKNDLFDLLEEKFEEQQSRIDRLEAKINGLTENVQQNNISVVVSKIEKLENLMETMNNNVEKLTSYVE